MFSEFHFIHTKYNVYATEQHISLTARGTVDLNYFIAKNYWSPDFIAYLLDRTCFVCQKISSAKFIIHSYEKFTFTDVDEPSKARQISSIHSAYSQNSVKKNDAQQSILKNVHGPSQYNPMTERGQIEFS